MQINVSKSELESDNSPRASPTKMRYKDSKLYLDIFSVLNTQEELIERSPILKAMEDWSDIEPAINSNDSSFLEL